MTINIADNSPRISYTVAQGQTQTSFAVPFEFFDNSDLNVYIDGTLKTITTHYTVSGGDGSTGTVSMSVTGGTGGSTVVITRDIQLERTTDFPVSGAFNIVALNTELDRLVAIAADLDDRASRALQLTDFDAAVSLVLPEVDTRKGKTLAFNASTGAVEAGPSISDTQTVSAASADIALLADIQDGTTATNAITTVASNNSNVTTVAGISANVTTVAGISSDVTAVAADATDIGTVATNIASVNTVATNIADVITVANDLTEAVSEVETVANDLNEAVSEIDTVAGSITNVDTVGSGITNVNTVATNISNVNTVAGISANVTTVAGDTANIGTIATDLNGSDTIGTVATNISNVNSVAGNASNINSVAGNSTNINAVAGNATNINAVAADATDIGTVATDIANVNTVAGNNTNINTVAGISSNVTTVAGISSNVTTVAGISSDVTAVANDSSDIGTVASGITNINTVAGSITNVNTVATNLSGVNSFAERYRVGSSDPTTSLDEGDLFFNTTSNAYKFYDGSSWQTVNVSGIGSVADDSTPQLGGNLDVNGNNITSSGDLTIDVAGDIILDADGSDVKISDGGTHVGSLRNVSSDFVIQSIISDQNIIFKGNDGGSEINALSLDMSENGVANFAAGANFEGDIGINAATNARLTINDNVGEVGSGNLAFQAQNTAGSALKPMGFRAEDIRFATGSAERARIIDDGILVGKTSSNSNTVGIELSSSNLLRVARSGGATAYLNRKTNDGEIITLAKDGSSVGGIGVVSGNPFFANATTGGLKFGTSSGSTIVDPVNETGAVEDATHDLGSSGGRWRNLYLSRGVTDTTTTVSYASSIALTLNNGGIQTVTLTGDVTFTDSLADGEAIVLMLNAGASHSVTWTAVNYWVSSGGNSAPTLTAKDTIVLWKIGSDVYAAYAGSFA